MQLRNKPVKEPPKRQYANAYFLFYNMHKKNLKSEKGNNITKQIAKMWKELNKQEKAHYEELFQEEEKKHKQKLDLFYVENVQKSPGLTQDPRPKKPLSAILSYAAQRRKEFKEENPLVCPRLVTKLLCEEYRSLPSIQKQQYEDQFKQRFNQYKSALESWEKKSRKQELTDVKKSTKKTQKQIEPKQLNAGGQKASQKIRIVVKQNRSASKGSLRLNREINDYIVTHEFTEPFSNSCTINQISRKEPIFFAQFTFQKDHNESDLTPRGKKSQKQRI